MALLVLTSLIWSLSFGLIKSQLTDLDPSFVAAVRLGISALVFLPFVLRSGPRGRLGLELMAIGAIQFGLMYLCVIRSYAVLAGWQVALLTVLTPLHVVLLEGLRRRRLAPHHLLAALLAIAGAGWISWPSDGSWSAPLEGVMLVQLANLCFAAGQLAYRSRVPRGSGLSHPAAMGQAYLGAVLVAGAVSLVTSDPGRVQPGTEQLWALAYLGAVASGLGFFLWNVGATRVRVGTLAVMNNLKVPLGVLVALTVFGESADWERLVPGAVAVGLALLVAASRGDSEAIETGH